MKGTIFAVAALMGLASAGSFHDRRGAHAQFHELKREAATGASQAPDSCNTGCVSCTTIYSTWYGEATLVPEPAPATTSTSTSTSAAPSSTYVPPPSSAAPSTSEAASTSAAPSGNGESKAQQYGSNSGNSGNSGNSAQINTGGSLYAMSYTPYKTDNGASRCASADEVSSDISQIAAKGFKTIRSYATDCNGLVNIANACKASGMKMIVGIFVDHSGVSSGEVSNQINDIKSHFNGDYSIVEMVLLGNEVLFNNFASASQLAGAISSLKQELKGAGYNGPVSTADTVASLQENEGALCDSMDVLAANIHPFFNDAVSASDAGNFVSNQMTILKGVCGGSKKAINSETGWPSNGSNNGAAVPSVAQQLLAISSIKQMAGGESVFFSFENDAWKGPGYLGVESHWGCANVFPG